MVYINSAPTPPTQISAKSTQSDIALRGKVKDLEKKVHRLEMLNQAMFEFLTESINLSVDMIEAKVREIDLRDGIEDERVSEIPLKCPACARVSSSKHWRCLYCGLEFERPVLG